MGCIRVPGTFQCSRPRGATLIGNTFCPCPRKQSKVAIRACYQTGPQSGRSCRRHKSVNYRRRQRLALCTTHHYWRIALKRLAPRPGVQCPTVRIPFRHPLQKPVRFSVSFYSPESAPAASVSAAYAASSASSVGGAAPPPALRPARNRSTFDCNSRTSGSTAWLLKPPRSWASTRSANDWIWRTTDSTP